MIEVKNRIFRAGYQSQWKSLDTHHFFKALLTALFGGVLVGVGLWMYSDFPPPYGSPLGEVSHFFWPLITDMVRKWRSLTFEFWDRGVCAGISLFQSGQYPISNPLNAVGWFLNDDQAFLFTLVAPYSIGTFSMAFLLQNVFGLRWFYAWFGALNYMALNMGSTICLSQPMYIFGAALFPAMIWTYLKLGNQSMYLRAAAVGGLTALQFALAGVVQFPQIFLWWILFFFVTFAVSFSKEPRVCKVKDWSLSTLLFVIMAVGLCGFQFMPTLDYAMHESGRSVGYYPTLSFSFGHFGNLFHKAFVNAGPISAKAILAFMLGALGLVIAHPKRFYAQLPHRLLVMNLWITSMAYIAIPQLLEMLSALGPSIKAVLGCFTMMNFAYATHIIDFCFSLTLCLVISRDDLSLKGCTRMNFFLAAALFFLAALCVAAPMLLTPVSFANVRWGDRSFLSGFVSLSGMRTAFIIFSLTSVVLAQMAYRFRTKTIVTLFVTCLLMVGVMRIKYGYDTWDKGRKSRSGVFDLAVPEITYLRAAGSEKLVWPLGYIKFTEGRVSVSFWPDYLLLKGNLGLLYGVRMVNGGLALHPLYIQRHVTMFKQIVERMDEKSRRQIKLNWPGTLMSYWRIDLLVVPKGRDLAWGAFRKEVSGDQVDIWARRESLAPVRFANTVTCSTLEEIVDYMVHVPFEDTLLIRKEDCQNLGVKDELAMWQPDELPTYSDFMRESSDRLQFNTTASYDTYVFIPEMYSRGWSARIDGKEADVIPAFDLFLSLRIPAGDHRVEFRFIPKMFGVGTTMSFSCVILFACLCAKYRSTNLASVHGG